MLINKQAYESIIQELKGYNATLVAVSKTKPLEAIKELYELGHRDFGENYVQEMVDKAAQLPADIRWHFIGHLHSNKVEYIAPFVHLVHGVDSPKLLQEINKQAIKNNRMIDVLLQVHIAKEETKFGLDENELEAILVTEQTQLNTLENVRIQGLMGMASFTEDNEEVKKEFEYLSSLFNKYAPLGNGNYDLQTLSMGMSGDYRIALEAGSNMVRIGSLLFGERNYKV